MRGRSGQPLRALHWSWDRVAEGCRALCCRVMPRVVEGPEALPYRPARVSGPLLGPRWLCGSWIKRRRTASAAKNAGLDFIIPMSPRRRPKSRSPRRPKEEGRKEGDGSKRKKRER